MNWVNKNGVKKILNRAIDISKDKDFIQMNTNDKE